MSAPAWLTARPIAHRGLHTRENGIIENTLSAAHAAIERGFSIECDVQLTGDGEAVVFHDFTLERLTNGSGEVLARSAAALSTLAIKDSADRISTLAAFLAAIDGRAPLIIEIKSRFDGDWRLAERVAAVSGDYGGPIAIKSFDAQVIAHLRVNANRHGIDRHPLGIVAEARYDDHKPPLPPSTRENLAAFLHYPQTRPDFLSWRVDDLPHAIPFLARTELDMPVTAWTVRREAQRALAAQWADQIVFEGFLP
ncbi:MAG: glycerophosphodiester phosphodiesterase [Methylobacteriaceae bacterium]|nr:glycerophosphodiester phosphodiesterase [Methylobacteriaceae bacterium]